MFGSPADLTPPGGGSFVEPGSVDIAELQKLVRSQGRLALDFSNDGTRTLLMGRCRSGCLQIRLPRGEGPSDAPCAVVINTAGGLVCGDRLDQSVRWGDAADAIVTTQAAEKIYRALAHGASVAAMLDVGPGARAEWLPQETILFNRARLRRDTRVLLAEDASFLGVEAIVLGRKAMGEDVRRGSLSDRMRIWRGGKLVYADALELENDISALMQRAAIGKGARGMAVIVHAVGDASRKIADVRDALQASAGMAAASTWNGLLAVRLMSPDGETLRHDIALALAPLRGGRPLPRVWRC